LSCPGPSLLNRPHPPHSQAHRNFTAWRLIRDAFAVRERLGDPRVVPGFHCIFLPDMPSPMSPGRSESYSSSFLDSDIGLHRDLSGAALPCILPSVSSRARISGLTGSPSLRPVWLLAPLTDRPGFLPATGAFTSGLSTSWSPSSLLDITSTVTGPPLSVGLSPTGICSYPRCTRSVRAGFPHTALASRGCRASPRGGTDGRCLRAQAIGRPVEGWQRLWGGQRSRRLGSARAPAGTPPGAPLRSQNHTDVIPAAIRP